MICNLINSQAQPCKASLVFTFSRHPLETLFSPQNGSKYALFQCMHLMSLHAWTSNYHTSKGKSQTGYQKILMHKIFNK